MLGLKDNSDIYVDPNAGSDWKRSKRNMQEKVRLYQALKRGDVEDTTGKYDVDFDTKWANAEDDDLSEQEDDEDSVDEAAPAETVEYVDEFGRRRTGTRAEAAREKRRTNRSERAAAAIEDDRVRPAEPEAIIYGHAIQHEAFKPSEDVAERMAYLASQRDRSATPPEQRHYDHSEMRSRGTGFFKFSTDEAERKRQMDELDELRKETEKARGQPTRSKEKAEQDRERRAEHERQRVRDKKEWSSGSGPGYLGGAYGKGIKFRKGQEL